MAELAAVPAHRSLVDEAVAVLRESILDGMLAPGSRIRLTEVANRLGMSPIPVREALRILMQDGLVELVPHRGYRVRPVSVADLDDTYMVRKQLDAFAARQAVGRLHPADLDRLEDVLVRMRDASEAGDFATRRRLHRQFHFGLYNAVGSPWLDRLLSSLWETSERYQRLSSRVRGSTSDVLKEHGLILEAIRAHDADAAEARMREHLQRTEDSVRRVLTEGAPSEGWASAEQLAEVAARR